MFKTTRSLLLAAAVLPLAAACAAVRTPTAMDATAVEAPRANHNTTTACSTSAQAPTLVTLSTGAKKVRTVYQIGCTAGVFRIFVQGTLRTSNSTQNGTTLSKTCQSATTGGTVGGCTVTIDVDAPGVKTLYYGHADGAVRFHSTDASAVTLSQSESASRYCSTAGCTTSL